MPNLPPKRCGSPGCKEFVPAFTRYCDQHQKQSWKKTDYNRGGKDPFYDSKPWRELRAYVLAQEPICRACKHNAAKLVDHIIPRAKGGAELSLDNLQALCWPCHNQKTGRERK